MAEILLHHMVAENYYWLVQVWIVCLLLLKHNIVILVEPSVGQILDCNCTLVNGHVFEQLVLFIFTAGVGGGKKKEREFCSIFCCQYFDKGCNGPFHRWETKYKFPDFQAGSREMEKKEEL